MMLVLGDESESAGGEQLLTPEERKQREIASAKFFETLSGGGKLNLTPWLIGGGVVLALVAVYFMARR